MSTNKQLSLCSRALKHLTHVSMLHNAGTYNVSDAAGNAYCIPCSDGYYKSAAGQGLASPLTCPPADFDAR